MTEHNLEGAKERDLRETFVMWRDTASTMSIAETSLACKQNVLILSRIVTGHRDGWAEHMAKRRGKNADGSVNPPTLEPNAGVIAPPAGGECDSVRGNWRVRRSSPVLFEHVAGVVLHHPSAEKQKPDGKREKDQHGSQGSAGLFTPDDLCRFQLCIDKVLLGGHLISFRGLPALLTGLR
jgi:hypothetical protein